VEEVAKKLGIPIGKTSLIYEGVGTVQAGFNLKELVVSDLDFKNRVIKAELPAPRILNINLDIARSSKIDDYRSWFGPAATVELYEEAQREALAIIREKACSGNLFKAANSSAKEQLRTILNKAGFNTVTVEVESGNCAA
jgi:2',3'-cyclic-nucleotide 2'-phosphodiesterase (5'-nucleotidase family)